MQSNGLQLTFTEMEEVGKERKVEDDVLECGMWCEDLA